MLSSFTVSMNDEGSPSFLIGKNPVIRSGAANGNLGARLFRSPRVSIHAVKVERTDILPPIFLIELRPASAAHRARTDLCRRRRLAASHCQLARAHRERASCRAACAREAQCKAARKTSGGAIATTAFSISARISLVQKCHAVGAQAMGASPPRAARLRSSVLGLDPKRREARHDTLMLSGWRARVSAPAVRAARACYLSTLRWSRWRRLCHPQDHEGGHERVWHSRLGARSRGRL